MPKTRTTRKRRPAARNPSAASLRELPEIDFHSVFSRPNPFAKRCMREGVRSTELPSAETLTAIPEADFSRAHVRANPYAPIIEREGVILRIAEETVHLQSRRGRPPAARATGGTTPRSVRFPDKVWKALEKKATRKGMTLHAALREAIAEWLGREP